MDGRAQQIIGTKHEKILRSLQNMTLSVESIKGGKTEQDSLCCSLSLLLGLLDGSYSSSRGILSGNFDSVHKHLVSTGHLRSDIAAVGPAFELVCVSVIASKEAHLSRADVLLLQKPTAAYCRLPQH